MDRLPPSDPLSDFSPFGASDTGDFPAPLREETVGRRAPARQAPLEDALRRVTAHLDRIDADPDLRNNPQQLQSDLRDLHQLLESAREDCQFAGRELTGVRATALMGAVYLRASRLGTPGEPPLSDALRSWRGEMRSMLAHAVKAGAEGVSSNHSDCLLVVPFSQQIPTDLPAAVRDRDAPLAALTRAAPERFPTLPGHDALCMAQALLQSLPSSDLLDGDALPRWQSALAGALALETEAFAAVRHQRARPSEAIRHLMRHHELPRAP